MEKNNLHHDKEHERIATLFFDLLNPYKGGEFVLKVISDPSHSVSKNGSPMSAVTASSPRTRDGASPPPRRALFTSPPVSAPTSAPSSSRPSSEVLATSELSSPRTRSQTVQIESSSRRGSGHLQHPSPAGPHLASSAPQIGLKASKGGALKAKRGPAVELSERSSSALQSLKSPMAMSGSRPSSRERSREPSFNAAELRIPKLSDEPMEGNVEEVIEKVFNPVKAGFGKRLVYNVAKKLDKRKAEDSKKKKGRDKSRVATAHSTPVMSTNTSPRLSRSSGPEQDFSYWNEIIPETRLYLGVQPTKSNHPFLVDNPFFSIDPHAKAYLLNPTIFPGKSEDADKIHGCVFTFQEAYEMSGGLFDDDTLIDHNIFHSHGIVTRWLPFADNTGEVGEDLALFRLYDMMSYYLDDLPIYLNCKSGKGRSAIFAILFLAFCFLLDKRVANDKDALLNYINIDDPTMDQAEYDKIWALKRTRLLVVVGQISKFQKNDDYVELITTVDKPSHQMLKLLLEICESVVRKARKIKPGEEQRGSALNILIKLTDSLYASERCAHPNSKSHNTAFIDALTQTAILRDIHILMDGVKTSEDPTFKSFQEFLMRLVYNKNGWYDELIYATEDDQNALEGECGYFAKVPDEDVRLKRVLLLKLFRKEVESLLKKYPSSDYAKQFLQRELLKLNSLVGEVADPPRPTRESSIPKSPRSLSLNSRALSPRNRASHTISFKQQALVKKEESVDEVMNRDRSRTFDKAALPLPKFSGVFSPRMPSSPTMVRSPKSEEDSKDDTSNSSSTNHSDHEESRSDEGLTN